MSPRQSPAEKLFAQLLLGGAWAPVTGTINFVNLPLNEAAEEWRIWSQVRPTEGTASVGVTEHSGTLPELLDKLLPLSDWPRRRLLIETENKDWTAVFANCKRDPNLEVALKNHFSEVRGVTTVKVEDEPRSIKRIPNARSRGLWGSRGLTVYDKDGLRRWLSLRNFEPWRFDQNGEPYPFEDLDRYNARKTPDRFTHDMLVEYCLQLGLRPFDESFYAPNGRGIVVEEIAEDYDERDKYTLAEARAGYEDLSRPIVEEPIDGNALYAAGPANGVHGDIFPRTGSGYESYRKPSPWNEELDAFEVILAKYSSHPVRATLSEGLAERGVLAFPAFTLVGDPLLDVHMSSVLLEAPAEIREYTAAYMSLQFEESNNRWLHESFRPSRSQMATIRDLYKEHGLYPFDTGSEQVYRTLAIDKVVREKTDLRITEAFHAWNKSTKPPAQDGQLTADSHGYSVSWKARRMIQLNEDAIWACR